MKEADAGEGLQYLRGWAAVTELMLQGKSWSGNERNDCYLNLGGGKFAEGAFVTGLDFPDDGRAVAVADWDGDGDLDLWLRNRTGPQLRYMRNDAAGDHHFVELRLVGTRCNRDAIGAVVEVDSGGRTLVRSLAAGDGYLSQSSKRLHFGLGDSREVGRVVVRWPGGEAEEIAGVAADGRYEIRQGTGVAKPVEAPGAGVAEAAGRETAPAVGAAADRPDHVETPAGEAAGVAGAGRVLLRDPLPLPPSLSDRARDAIGPGVASQTAPPESSGTDRPTAFLVTFWAQWCAPCLEELEELGRAAPALEKSGLRVVALDLDAPEDRAKASAWFDRHVGAGDGTGVVGAGVLDAPEMETVEALMRHMLAREGEMVLPTSLLVDAEGRIQMVYLGRAPAGELRGDVARWVFSDQPDYRRSLTTGRWYFRTPRDYAGLAADLESRGRERDAAFYRSLVPAVRETTPGPAATSAPAPAPAPDGPTPAFPPGPAGPGPSQPL